MTERTDPLPAEEAPLEVSAGGLMTRADEVIAYRRAPEDVARAASCVHGRVLEGGLGFGGTRDALIARDNVELVETVEIDQGVIAQYQGDPTDLVQADIRDVVAAQAASPGGYDSALFDVPDELLGERKFQIDLKTAFPRAGQRVAMICEESELELEGFVRGLTEPLIAGGYLHLFDRFEPEAGVGVRNPHGDVYVPGYGWQRAPKLIQIGEAEVIQEETP